MKPFKKIVVPTDFSELSGAAFDTAISLADTYGAELVVLHIVDDSSVFSLHAVDLRSDLLFEEEFKNATADVQRFLDELHVEFGREITVAVRRGNPFYEITRFAEEFGADLIVMATHGRTGLVHILLGSVAEKVVQHSHIPVLTVKPESMRRRSAGPAAMAAPSQPSTDSR